jgi:hypothetical protein
VGQIAAFSHFEVWIQGLFLAASVIYHNHPAKKNEKVILVSE